MANTIDAKPERIWAILTDAARYPEWDPGVLRIEGAIEPGQKIKVFTKLSPKRAFPVKVSTFEPPRLMKWTGGMPLGLFKGERTFELTPAGEAATRFSMHEVFSGPMLALIKKSLPDFGPIFEAFATALKSRAEEK